MAIRLNAQFKQKGRPTLVNTGVEGQRYLASKIIGNLVATQPAGRQEYVSNLSVVKSVVEEGDVHAQLNYWKHSFSNGQGSTSEQQPAAAPEASLDETAEQVEYEQSLVHNKPFQPKGRKQVANEPSIQAPAHDEAFEQLFEEEANHVETNSAQEEEPTPVIDDIQQQTHLHFFKNCRLTKKMTKPAIAKVVDEGFPVFSTVLDIAKISDSTVEKMLAERSQQPEQQSEPMNEQQSEAANEQQFEQPQQPVAEEVEEQVSDTTPKQPKGRKQVPTDDSEPQFQDADEKERFENGKTMILGVPKPGVVKSCRGTVQLLVQKTGRTMKPRYNQCGLLTAVEMSDGWELVYMPKRNRWIIINHDGTTPLPLKITSVSFDQKGNLWYVTADGQRTIFYADGTSETI